jgi:hypothetical protein
MRVVWKDSNVRKYHKTKYRGYEIEQLEGGGCIINREGDDNTYSGRFSAMNAIDEYLGGSGQRGEAKRKELGVNIIGKRNETA